MSNDTQPEIRFPGFTEAWEQRKLGEFVTIRSGWSPSNFEEANDKGSLFVKVDDLNSSTRVQNNSNMKVIENPKYDKMKQGSTIFPKRGAAIMTNKVRILGENGYMDTNMMALEPSGIVGEFLYTFISRTGLYKIADTSTIPQINNKHIEPYEISLPEIKEQQKIGIFFKQLDDTITLHQSKLDLLKETKKGFLQKMFPKNGAKVPEIRFSGFTEDWEQRKLGEIVQITMGQSPNSENYTENPEDYILVQGNADMKNNRVVPRVWTTQITKQAEKGDLILSVRAPVGDIGKTDYDVVLGRGVAAIKGNDFIFQQLGKMKESGYWNRFSTGSTFESINSNDIREALITIPTGEEQQKIGAFFKQLDDTIALHQRKLDLLKETKKSFLQKMFV
ncbi:restriction endonuclease subunit S [Enterococcus lactis]|uniref:restriction endonuclease subunit S n=1 Tax=Enterococcus TaxID=1350 RepID=UPI00064C98AF|nr:MULTISPECIES: restriction endonuclease subunit S [Enterococcus]EMF0626171.1 restriction endonuclease subunit S [Enterococcus faecium]MDW8525033.1 restriction endonuclease subunit S [Enterococcus lactis]MEB7841183.1 restriction endonuclease subunit S [Enterococcus lactis]MEB7854493.1 restriction endonuclease subunit S [Enterococcus lactis]PWF39694.1 restriction endonuclease subunit S [Enterococcus faecium]